MESLPCELMILNIVSRLSVSFLVQFKSVCKDWRMLAQDPDLVNMHSTRIGESNPCLIFRCNYLIRNQLYFVKLPACINKKEKVKNLHVPFSTTMPEFDVVGSCNGLLCLSDPLFSDALYIHNPFSRNYQVLPKSIQYLNQELDFGFGFHPTTKEYKVIKFYCNYKILEIWVMKKYGAGESWNKKFRIGNYVPMGLEKDEDQYFEILKNISKRSALISKLGWQMVNESDNTWKRMLTEKYLNNSSFLNISHKPSYSWIWKGILKQKDFLKTSVYFQVNNGVSIKVWTDP
ncbi:F-box protein At3g07870-like [Juglans microcarpa x Juglans regia]|uniref:F-box protein At3g07870-like n=1 Tax=Juglans microcarpa x Juglans regia TaxID=2249226 RepID=UPI001B7E5D27|nr:F-box protein At3g07870-like [Juglans microcarpa x Juglans regia]